MEKQTVKFAVESKNGVVTNIGNSIIMQPTINFCGGSVKWFDDTRLLKANKKKEKSCNE